SQLQAESRGWVRIRSADPQAPPAIQYNYLSTENDRRTMVEGLKFARRLVTTPPLAGYVAGEFQPGEKVQSDEEWLAFCREAGDTVFHPTSTCRMGTDAASVVDERLRVRGVGGLRVIDASVMPSVVSGNTNAAVIALAEKGADIVREDAEM
ncbi:MAG TPA: GMC oxidoreductase, partial [Burkholderiales bacterium]|nr:GMC oxidoreductase [Burkholderiales bacterium]